MLKKTVSILFMCIFLTASLCACSAGSKSNSLNEGNVAKDYKEDAADVEQRSADTGATSSGGGKIIIKNAQAALTVKNAEKAVEAINAWVSSNGGYEFSRGTNVAQTNTRIHVVYKINPDRLQAFIDMLKDQGEVTSSNIKSDDITEEYYDASARLESLQRGREQFLEILKKANTIDEILKVQEEINRISSDIEALQGKINLWNSMALESTAELTITEETDPIASANINWNFTSAQDVFKIMKNGFVLTTNFIVSAISWIFIIVVSLLPLIIIGVIAFFAYRYLKKMKKGK